MTLCFGLLRQTALINACQARSVVMRDCMDQPTTRRENRSMAARAKAFVSEQAIEVVNDALQMFGAKGYGNEVPLERMYRDVRMFTIGGGTAQILKTQVAGALWGDQGTPDLRRVCEKLNR